MGNLEQVSFVLDKAKAYNLEAEVICSAMSFLKKHPEKDIEAALAYGLCEWDI